MTSPTPRLYVGVHTVEAYCRHCRHPKHRTLDLQKLMDRGYGGTPLLELPLRCVDCGKRGHGIRAVTVENWSAPGKMGAPRSPLTSAHG